MGGSQDPGKAATLSAFVAWLSAVNVGGANRLAMADLRALFSRAGATRVETYIQSGNLAFCASAAHARRLADEVEAALAHEYGVTTTIVLVDAAALRRVVDANPFLRRAEEPTKLHVQFFAGPVAAGRWADIDPGRFAPDEFAPGENCVYLFLPQGVARTKLSAAWLASRLDVTTTQRNWATATRLLAMVEALACGAREERAGPLRLAAPRGSARRSS